MSDIISVKQEHINQVNKDIIREDNIKERITKFKNNLNNEHLISMCDYFINLIENTEDKDLELTLLDFNLTMFAELIKQMEALLNSRFNVSTELSAAKLDIYNKLDYIEYVGHDHLCQNEQRLRCETDAKLNHLKWLIEQRIGGKLEC